MLVDLRQLHLPFCNGSSSLHEKFPDVSRLRREVSRNAHRRRAGQSGNHGSFSGVLENALDLTEPEDWQSTMMGLIGIFGRRRRARRRLVGLRTVGRGLSAWVLRDKSRYLGS